MGFDELDEFEEDLRFPHIDGRCLVGLSRQNLLLVDSAETVGDRNGQEGLLVVGEGTPRMGSAGIDEGHIVYQVCFPSRSPCILGIGSEAVIEVERHDSRIEDVAYGLHLKEKDVVAQIVAVFDNTEGFVVRQEESFAASDSIGVVVDYERELSMGTDDVADSGIEERLVESLRKSMQQLGNCTYLLLVEKLGFKCEEYIVHVGISCYRLLSYIIVTVYTE